MADIQDILNQKPSAAISLLRQKSIDIPSWTKLLRDYEPKFHKITHDHVGRKDKIRKDKQGNVIAIEPAARISFGLERLLVHRMSEFMFSTPVRRLYHNINGSKQRQEITKAIEAIYKVARIDTENLKRASLYFSTCELFTLWYTVKRKNSVYGFDSNYKLRCKTFSPMDGTRLWPLIDEYGDMSAMSLEYYVQSGLDRVYYFETYTDTERIKWRLEGSEWKQIDRNPDIQLLKIPGVYIYRNRPIWDGLTGIRNEIEYTMSRNSDVIAYNSAPVLKVAGQVKGTEDKGETRRVYRVENGGDVSYVSWTQAIEALKYHVTTLLNMFWSQAQMPDISFDNMKDLGNIGFDARQTLLTDAHLKVGDEAGVWIEALEREGNVIKAFLKLMKPEWSDDLDAIDIEHIITPFIQNNETSEAERILKLNGNKPVMSHLESIRYAGYSTDPEYTLRQIQEEEKIDSSTRAIRVQGIDSSTVESQINGTPTEEEENNNNNEE